MKIQITTIDDSLIMHIWSVTMCAGKIFVAERNDNEVNIDCCVMLVSSQKFFSVVESITAKLGHKKIQALLENKIPELFPLDNELLSWCYLVKDNKIKIVATTRKKVAEIYKLISQENASYDAVVPTILFSDAEDQIQICKDVYAYISHDTEFRHLYGVHSWMPEDKKRHRYRGIISLWRFLSIGCVLTGMMVLITGYNRYVDTLKQLEAKRIELNELVSVAKAENNLSRKKLDISAKLLEKNIGVDNIVSVISELSTVLPDEIYMTTFNTNGDLIEVALETTNDSANLYKALEASRLLEVVNLRKSNAIDNRTTYFVKLKEKK